MQNLTIITSSLAFPRALYVFFFSEFRLALRDFFFQFFFVVVVVTLAWYKDTQSKRSLLNKPVGLEITNVSLDNFFPGLYMDHARMSQVMKTKKRSRPQSGHCVLLLNKNFLCI